MLIDVGTNNEAVRSAPGYGGVRAPRLRGDAYASLLSEVVHAVRAWAPRAVLQFEDFGNTNAFTLLRAHRTTLPCFNDDIEGTASVACAAVLAAVRAQAGAGAGARLSAQRFLFLGAGEAGTGIADLIVLALVRRHGLSEAEARRRCVFLDSKGLVCASRLEGGGAGALPAGHPRRGLADHKVAYAHPLPFVRTLLEAVHAVRPTVLVGVSTKRGAFTPDVLCALADGCAREGLRPLVMPLSNPTDMSECTYQDALAHAGDGVLFASGSPFPPCAAMGRLGPRRAPPQANNAYVFPAIGRAAYETCARAIDAEAFLVAAEALAALPTDADVADGALFPPVASMAEASLKVRRALRVEAAPVLAGVAAARARCCEAALAFSLTKAAPGRAGVRGGVRARAAKRGDARPLSGRSRAQRCAVGALPRAHLVVTRGDTAAEGQDVSAAPRCRRW